MDGRQHAGEVMPFHALFLALVTPPLAAILLLVVFGARPLGVPMVLATLAPAYVAGFAPAFLAGRFDQSLARRGWRAVGRLLVAAGLACITGTILLAPLHLTGRLHGALPLLFPLVLALSAVLALTIAQLSARLLAGMRRRNAKRRPLSRTAF